MSDDDWRHEAERRIERHRTGACRVALRHAGMVVQDLRIRVEQVASAFHFGTCLTGDPTDADERRYFDTVRSWFDAAVCENAMKWYASEPTSEAVDFAAADALADYCTEHELALRGHCLLWSKRKFVQEWVDALDDQALADAIRVHVERTVGRYAGRVICWDALNEMLDGRYFRDRLGEDFPAELFRQAAAVDPAAPLFVNEYGILDSDERTDAYLALIADLRARGAPVGGIGIQEHACERFAADQRAADADEGRPERQGRGPLIPTEVWARCDRLAATGLPVHLTEVSCKTSDETRRAEALDLLLTTAYAHPAIDAVMLWGFWSRRHWLGRDAALFADDWTVTPAGERWQALVLDRWRTRIGGVSDQGGGLDFHGHFGRYRVCRAADGQPLGHFDHREDGHEVAIVLH